MKSELKQFPLLPIFYSAIPGMQRTIIVKNRDDYKKLYRFFKTGKSYAVRLPLPQSRLYLPNEKELFVEHTVEQMDASKGTVQVYAMPIYQSANLLPDSNLMLGYELEPFETNVWLGEELIKGFDEIAKNLVLFSPIPPYEEVEGIYPNTIYYYRMLSTLNSYYDPRKLSNIEEILEFIYEKVASRKMHYFFKAVIRLDTRIRERYVAGLQSSGYTQEANQNRSIVKLNYSYFNAYSHTETILDLLRKKKYEKFNRLYNSVRFPEAVSGFVNYSVLSFLTQNEDKKYFALFSLMGRKLSYLAPPSSVDYSKVPGDPSKIAIKNPHFEEVNSFLFSFAVEGITYQMMLDAIIPAAMGFRNATCVTLDLKNEENIAFNKFFASADNLAETLLLHFGVYTAIITLPMATDEVIEAEMYIFFSIDKLIYEIASTIQNGYEQIYRETGSKAARIFAADAIGVLLGYPQCCIEQYQKVIELTDSSYSNYYQHFGSMLLGLDITSYKDFYPSMFTVGFIPCSDNCAHASSLGELLRSQYISLGRNFHTAANLLYKHIKIIFRENIQDFNRQSEIFHKVLDDHSDLFVFDNSVADDDLRQYHWQYRKWDINAFFNKIKLMFETPQEQSTGFNVANITEDDKYAPLDEREIDPDELPSDEELKRFYENLLLDFYKPHRDIGEGRDYDRMVFHDRKDLERKHLDDDWLSEFDDDNPQEDGEDSQKNGVHFFDFTDEDDEDEEPDFFRDLLRRFGKETDEEGNSTENNEEEILSDEETPLRDFFIKLDDETSTPKRKPKKDDSDKDNDDTMNQLLREYDNSYELDDEDEEEDDDEEEEGDDKEDDKNK